MACEPCRRRPCCAARAPQGRAPSHRTHAQALPCTKFGMWRHSTGLLRCRAVVWPNQWQTRSFACLYAHRRPFLALDLPDSDWANSSVAAMQAVIFVHGGGASQPRACSVAQPRCRIAAHLPWPTCFIMLSVELRVANLTQPKSKKGLYALQASMLHHWSFCGAVVSSCTSCGNVCVRP